MGAHAGINASVATWNEEPKPFVWHKSADQILDRLAGYSSTFNTGNLTSST
jgi:hypothetical protein